MDKSKLIAQLKLHEGVRLKVYRCTAGKLTIGVGRNLEDAGISEEESDFMLLNDIDRFHTAIQDWPAFKACNEVRQRVLIDMAFNLGVRGLATFKNTLAAIERGEFDRAADMMLESLWAKQVGRRATRLSQMMRSGLDTP